jgi:hypothetical protein
MKKFRGREKLEGRVGSNRSMLIFFMFIGESLRDKFTQNFTVELETVSTKLINS